MDVIREYYMKYTFIIPFQLLFIRKSLLDADSYEAAI